MPLPVNPALTALGYAPSDRVVIFHADDVGMCQATVTAHQDLMGAALLSSSSVMMPCSWSRGAAYSVATFPDADVGVHWTMTSEWRDYRWRPLTKNQYSDLTDADGFFHADVASARRARPESVLAEMKAQLMTALHWGMDVTHVDAHMGAIAHPAYMPGLIELAVAQGIPVMLPRLDVQGWQATGLNDTEAAQAASLVLTLEERGLPLVDHLRMLPLDAAGDHAQWTRQALRDLPPGLTHFILHPAHDTPELRAICGDWTARVANYAAFMDTQLKKDIDAVGIQVIGYRPLRDLLRRKTGWSPS